MRRRHTIKNTAAGLKKISAWITTMTLMKALVELIRDIIPLLK
jgi:hypothetical protein